MIRYIVILFLLLLAGKAGAQSFTGTSTGIFTVDSMYVLTASAGSQVNFTGGVTDYASAKVVSSYSTITIKCNYNWIVSVKAKTANFTVGAGGSVMPCSVLRIRKTGGSYFTITTNAQQLALGNKGNTAVSGNTFTVDLEANPGFNYNSGLYSIDLEYTVTKQ